MVKIRACISNIFRSIDALLLTHAVIQTFLKFKKKKEKYGKLCTGE